MNFHFLENLPDVSVLNKNDRFASQTFRSSNASFWTTFWIYEGKRSYALAFVRPLVSLLESVTNFSRYPFIGFFWNLAWRYRDGYPKKRWNLIFEKKNIAVNTKQKIEKKIEQKNFPNFFQFFFQFYFHKN